MEPSLTIKEFPNEVFKCTYSIGETIICKCTINLDTEEEWLVTGWYTDENYKNQGIGKLTMQKLLNHLYAKFGKPQNILYIWNGMNRYVYDWIKTNFDAYCRCPISVQKYQSEDDWDSHMYILDVDKLFTYFGIRL